MEQANLPKGKWVKLTGTKPPQQTRKQSAQHLGNGPQWLADIYDNAIPRRKIMGRFGRIS